MNLAIIIGVSDYKNKNNLPGCRKDVDIVLKIIEVTSKWDDILTISEQTDSPTVKRSLTEFIKKYEDKQVEDVFFYFTGHGLFDGEEFYYVLTDFSENKKKQTSLENSELDSLLRSLKARVTVKIVDSCQSGTRYIKDIDTFKKFFKGTERDFQTCYFYYSSQSDQYSYQSKQVSDFTYNFARAFIDRQESEVRYKDIADSLSDAFSGNIKQTPFFISQGDYTELFGFITQEGAKALEHLLEKLDPSENKELSIAEHGLLEMVMEDAKRYCAEDEAKKIVGNIETVCQSIEKPEGFDDFFDLKIQCEENSPGDMPIEYITDWFSENKRLLAISSG